MTNSTAFASLTIIQMGEPPAPVAAAVGDQHHWFGRALGLAKSDYQWIRPDLGEPLPDPATLSAVLITGSWAMVTDCLPWSEATAAWVREVFDLSLPLFGVCYGHQLIAHALGGRVADNPLGWEGGICAVRANESAAADPLLSHLPARFEAWLSHRQTVLAPPAGAQVLAGSARDGCQVIRYSPQAMSVQFHPEFTRDIMQACLSFRAANQGPGVDQALESLSGGDDPQWPLKLLRRFYQRWCPSQLDLAADGDALPAAEPA